MDFIRGAAKAIWAAIGGGLAIYLVDVADLTAQAVEIAVPAAVTALLAYLIPNRGPKANDTSG